MTTTFPTLSPADIAWAEALKITNPAAAEWALQLARHRREQSVVTSAKMLNGGTVEVRYFPATNHYETCTIICKDDLIETTTLEVTQDLDLAKVALALAV